jgi:2,3-bisphosphoglycerate-independent phosphoglycerate mutase
LTDNITSTDPLKDNLPLLTALPLDQSTEAITTAKLVNELSQGSHVRTRMSNLLLKYDTEIHKKLEHHPINQERKITGKPVANIVLLRGCGSLIEAPTFRAKHGLTPFIIAPTAIIGIPPIHPSDEINEMKN